MNSVAGLASGSTRTWKLEVSGSAERWFPVILAVVTALAVVLAIEPWPVGVFQDDGIYVILAKSLAEGEGYRYLNLPGTPNATHYPPLYPAFLALLWKVYPSFPDNVVLFKFANAVLLGIAAALFYRIGRKMLALPPLIAGIAVLAFTVCRPVLLLSAMVLSEPLFLVFLGLTLLAMHRAGDTGQTSHTATAAVLAVALTLIRSIGIAVLPPFMLLLIARRQWRQALIALVVAMAGILPWQLWVSASAHDLPSMLTGKYGPYSAWLIEAVRSDGWQFVRSVTANNFEGLFTLSWRELGIPAGAPNVLKLGSAVLSAILLVAGGRRVWRTSPTTAGFAAGYAFIVILWPFAPDRFLLGIWPLIGLMIFSGAKHIWNLGARLRLSNQLSNTRYVLLSSMFVAVCGAMFAAYVVDSARLEPRSGYVRAEKATTQRASSVVEWVSANADTDAIVVGESDGLIYLYTGRQAVPGGAFRPQDYTDPPSIEVAIDDLRAIIREYSPDYVFVSTTFGDQTIKEWMVNVDAPDLTLVEALAIGSVFKPVSASRTAGPPK